MTDLLECGHPESPHRDFTRGYGTWENGDRFCYACCAERDRKDMIETGRATLYLVERIEKRPLQNAGYYGLAEKDSTVDVKTYYVTNWPGSLEFKARHIDYKKYGGGFGSQRTDAWFTGPDGKAWHAVNRGDSQIARCRRLKG